MIKFFNHWLSKHSLKFKLNLSILTCVGLVFLCLVYILTEKSETIIKSQINVIAQKSIASYVEDFTHLISDAEQVALNTKNTLSQTKKENIEAIEVVINSAIKTVYHSGLNFKNVWVYIFPPEDVSSGNLYISSNKNADVSDFRIEQIDNLYERFPWFMDVTKEEKIYWSDPYIDKTDDTAVLTCLIPFKFKTEKDFNGLVALTVDLSDIQGNISNFSFYDAGRLILLSHSGLYVAHPNPTVALKTTIFELAKKLNQPILAEIGKKLVTGQSGQITIPRSSAVIGEATLYYAPIKHIGWSLGLIYAKNELLKPIHQFQMIIGFSLIICILALLIIINWICHNSTNQLTTLGNIATKYGKGDFTERFEALPLSTDVEKLAGALSNMRSNLLKYVEKEKKQATEKQKSKSELDIARHIQKSALSVTYPQSEAFEIATLMIPAQKVGGDFYDFFFIDEHKFAIVIADVSGKGIPAALYMMRALTLIKNISRSKKSLDFVFQHVNQQLCEGNDSCMFVTAFMAVIDLFNGKTKYINAGHTPPVIGTSENPGFMKVKKNILLGYNPNAELVEEEIKLKPNTHIFLYTDGVTEAENNKKKLYGEKRLLKTYQKTNGKPKENLEMILKDIKNFAKDTPQSDDITMLDFVFYGFPNNSITFSADIGKLGDILTYLKNDMNEHRLSEKAQFNMITASEEIFSNIALYAYHSKESAKVTVQTNLADGIYYISFIDNGKKYNPLNKALPDITTSIKNKSIGGLGILLARKLTDTQSYTYQNKQNILKIGIRIDK